MAASTAMRKVTISLPARLMDEVRALVDAGVFASQNAAVRKALEESVERARREAFERDVAEASRDPFFLQDLHETEQAFAGADAETARMIPGE